VSATRIRIAIVVHVRVDAPHHVTAAAIAVIRCANVNLVIARATVYQMMQRPLEYRITGTELHPEG